MSEIAADQLAAAEALEQDYVPLDNTAPQAQALREAVAQHIAEREGQ
jgi:hypothetical protein